MFELNKKILYTTSLYHNKVENTNTKVETFFFFLENTSSLKERVKKKKDKKPD